jgi:hypothetical protein
VRPADHALSGTLVDSPAPPAPAAPAPAPKVEVVTKGAPAAPSADDLLPPSDPWGSQLEGVEPAAPAAAPPPAPPPAVKLPERPQVSRGLYKFTKGRT